MFTDDVNESWDSTPFQDAFIRDYFGKQSVAKDTIERKAEKNYSSKNLQTVINIKNEYDNNQFQENICNKNESNLNVSSKKKKKKKKTSDSGSQLNDNVISPIKKSKSEKKCLKDSLIAYSNLLKSGKKLKFKSKAKNVDKKHSMNSKDSSQNLNESQKYLSLDTEKEIISDDSPSKKNNFFQNKAYQKLQAAKFRWLNEMLYTNTGEKALSYFQENTEEFQDYHMGYQSQVSKWPINPVDIIINELRKMNKQLVIADLGCGEAKIAQTLPDRTVHSFDLIALTDCVTACDVANVPLPNKSVDVTVFCLSLMGTNWKDYLLEAHRLLKLGALLKIAEIESRIENVDHFIKNIGTHGFSLINKNLSHKMFVFLTFKKVKKNVQNSKVKNVILKPCLYKKR